MLGAPALDQRNGARQRRALPGAQGIAKLLVGDVPARHADD
jgi:hypothetical protein